MTSTDPPASSRRRDVLFYFVACFIGAVTGVLGTALHFGVEAALDWPRLLRAHLSPDPHEILLATGSVSALMTLAAVLIVRSYAPEAGGSGVQEVEGAMEGLRKVRWARVLPVKFFGGLLSLGSGLVVGREGPTIHIGASVAQASAEALKLSTRESRGLLAAGAAAGLAAAFNAPLAAILFVIEETRRQFPYSIKTYTGVMLAAVVSDVVAASAAGTRPFMAISAPPTALAFLPFYALLGVLLGAVGVGFNRALLASLDLSLAIGRRLGFYLVPALVGFAIGLLLILRPEATMGGEHLAVSMAMRHDTLQTIAVIVAVRFTMTLASYSTGAPGGIFAPILALATACGLLYASCLDLFMTLPPGAATNLAVTAMGGLFSASIRAPLVGVVLIAELTGDYNSLVPAILTCLSANLVADWFGGRPVYEALLARTLRLSGQTPPAPSAAEKIGGWDQR